MPVLLWTEALAAVVIALVMVFLARRALVEPPARLPAAPRAATTRVR